MWPCKKNHWLWNIHVTAYADELPHSAEQLWSSAEEIQHGRALLKIFGCPVAKCLISSWFGNQIHVHLVLRSGVCGKKKRKKGKKGSRFTEEKQLHLKTRQPIGGFDPMLTVMLIPVAFFYDCGMANLKKQSFCAYSRAPIFFNDKCAFNQACKEILWIFSCNCSSFAVRVSRKRVCSPQTQPSPTDEGRNRPAQQCPSEVKL